MPDTTPAPAPKRSRALPRVWKRFIYLEPGDEFFIGRCRYIKSGLFRAVAFPTLRRINLLPWRKVQTDVLVRDALPGGKSSLLMDRAPFPLNMGETVIRDCAVRVPNDGTTHYVGDDCPGGHADTPVNNDNNITGPTS